MKNSTGILLTNFACSLLHAIFIPTFSLLLLKKYGLDSKAISLFFIFLAIASIIFSQFMGKISDNGFSRNLLIIVGLLGGACGCLTFAISSNKWLDASLGILLFSLTFVSVSQLIAYTRNFSDLEMSGHQSIRFNIIARAVSALGWVLGPALGFFIFELYGYNTLLYLVASGYLLLALSLKFTLPSLTEIEHSNGACRRSSSLAKVLNIKTIASALVFAMAFSCNQSYMITLPLYLIQSLSLTERHAGILLATSAAIEVGIMLAIGFLIKRFTIYSLLHVSFACAIILNVGFFLSLPYSSLLFLQLFNALYIGIAISLGAIWFQNILPNDTGTASALFTNSINVGIILGAIIVGISAYFGGYRETYLINSMLMLLATTIFLLFCRDNSTANKKNTTPTNAI